MTKPTDAPSSISSEKLHEEPLKSANIDENPDGEEIADDLSEISDEADDILAQQEVNSIEIHRIIHLIKQIRIICHFFTCRI